MGVRKRHTDPTFMLIILKGIPIVALLLFAYYLGIGQESSHYLNYTIQDGLPSNRIYSVIQNEEGYLYIGTDKGLCKFDGVSFDYFGYESGLPNLEILALYLDKKDRIWISSFSEWPLFLYRDSLHVVSTVPKQNPTIFSYGFIEPDTLVAYTKSQAFYLDIYSLSLHKIVKLNSRILGAINTLSYFSFLNDSRINMRLKDELIQYYNKRYFSITPNEYSWSPIFADVIPYIETYGPFKGGKCIERDSLLYARSTNGLLIFTLKDLQLSKTYLNHADIFGLDRDWHDRLLVGTKNDGLYIIEDKIIKSSAGLIKTYQTDGSLLFKDSPRANSSVFFFNKNHEFHSIDLNSQQQLILAKFSVDNISDFTIRGSELHLLLSGSVLYQIKPNQVLTQVDSFTSEDIVKHILELTENHFCAFSNRILFYNNYNCIDTIRYSPDVRTLCRYRLSDSIILVGTLSGFHIIKYNADNNSLSNYQSYLRDPISHIAGIAEDRFCVSSDAFGIKCFHLQERGLSETSHWHPSNDFIKQITRDDKTLLALSNKGLHRLSLPDLRFIDFIETNGSGPIQYIFQKEDKLLIAGKDVTQVYQGTISSQIPKAEMHIINVSSNEVTVDPSKLTALQNNLDIELSTPYFSQKPPTIHYKLVGIDDHYLTTNDRVIRLRNLPSGSYSFSAQAFVGGKPISQRITLPINLPPVFWKTWWFITLVILFFSGILYYYFLQSRNRQKAKTALLQQRLNALHAQMNPHFLFNALQSLQYYISKNDTKRTNTYLSTFATLVRKTLESSAQEYILLKDEIDYLTSYLEMEKEKLDGNLSYTFVCNDSLKGSTMIPTMIIQPFIENSIVHGFGSRSASNHIQIFFEETTSKEIRCEITDNGGFSSPNTPKSGHKSFSSKAVEKRIKLLHQLHKTSPSRNKTAIQILSNADTRSVFEEGTTVRLTLPCIQASHD